MAKISPTVVETIFRECLFHDVELAAAEADPTLAVLVDGIMREFRLHRERLENHRPLIEAMLRNLPDTFHVSGGGGMSFLKACNDCDNNQWTDLHRRMEELFVLGMGLGRVQYCAPREFWPALPGDMPYIVIDFKETK